MLEEGFQRLINQDPWHRANEFRRPVFLDSSDLTDLKLLESEVRHSHNIVLLLTPNVLTRPWCLVEIITALRNGGEIVPVLIDRPGISFQIPDGKYWTKLCSGDRSQGGLLEADQVKLLKEKGVDLKDLYQIRQVFEKI